MDQWIGIAFLTSNEDILATTGNKVLEYLGRA